MTKRPKKLWGDGTIWQDNKGVWWAQLPPDERGKRPKARAKSEKEALAKLTELNNTRREARNPTTVVKLAPTVKQVILEWLDSAVKRKVKENTYIGYIDECNRHLFRLLGDTPVDELTFQQVQSAMNKLVDEVSVRIAHYNYQRLRAGLHYAVKCNYIAKNPAEDVELPKLKTPEQTPPTIANLRKLQRKNEGHRLLLLINMISLFGLRKGEGLGQRWSDISWKEAKITLCQQITYFRRKGKDDKGTVGVGTLKTDDSYRELPIPPKMLNRLQEERKRQQEDAVLAGEKWSEDLLIFRTSKGTPFQPRNFSRDYKLMLKKAKLSQDFNIHDLRRCFATTLGNEGVPERIVAALLGHYTNGEVTWRYMNAKQSMRCAVELLEDILFAPTTPEEEEDDRREDEDNQEGKDE